MKAQPKPTTKPGGHCGWSFDSMLKEAINKMKGVPYVEKVKLYQAIVGICRQQVEDCTDGITAALYLQLHDDYGFGQKRINRLKDRTQATLDSYVERYEIGAVVALQRDLAERRIHIIPRGE